jgi:hypothetical protein
MDPEFPGRPTASVARNVKVADPAAVGIPLMVPVEPVRVRPLGSVPVNSVHV